MKNTEVSDITDMFTPDMAKAMDMLGIQFLTEHGFDVSDVKNAKTRRKKNAAWKRVDKVLESQNLVLEYCTPKIENNIYLFFLLSNRETGDEVWRSKAIQFQCDVVNVDGGASQSGT